MKERIKAIRKEAKETQQMFADRLNVSKSTIEGYEYGRLNIPDRMIADICREYHIDEHWLRTGDGEMHRPLDREDEIAKITDQMLSETEPSIRNSLHRIISDMSEDQLGTLLECARALVYEMDEKILPE